MGFVILRNQHTYGFSPYHGAICIMPGGQWHYITGLHGPDVYNTQEEALAIVNVLQKSDPGRYDIVPFEQFLQDVHLDPEWKKIAQKNTWANEEKKLQQHMDDMFDGPVPKVYPQSGVTIIQDDDIPF